MRWRRLGSEPSTFVVGAAPSWVRQDVVGFEDEMQALDVDGSRMRGVGM
jgi:hypothetical protein